MLPPFLLLRRLNRSGNRISKQNLVSFMISQSLNSLGNNCISIEYEYSISFNYLVSRSSSNARKPGFIIKAHLNFCDNYIWECYIFKTLYIAPVRLRNAATCLEHKDI